MMTGVVPRSRRSGRWTPRCAAPTPARDGEGKGEGDGASQEIKINIKIRTIK